MSPFSTYGFGAFIGFTRPPEPMFVSATSWPATAASGVFAQLQNADLQRHMTHFRAMNNAQGNILSNSERLRMEEQLQNLYRGLGVDT